MGYLDFVDQVLYDFTIYCDGNRVWGFEKQLAEIEQDATLSFEERRDAILSLRLANLIDSSKEEEMEEICRDLNRLRHQGHLYGRMTIIDHDRLGEDFWKNLDLRDDVGEPCWIHYNGSTGENDEYEPSVHFGGFMETVDQDTANFLLSARVETCLNLVDAREMVT